MIKIKDKTQLRKALRKNRKEKYLKINKSNGNWHFLRVILLKLKTEKVVLKNSVAISDKRITQLFKKWEAELNKKNQTEIKQDEIKSLKIELCQLKGVMESKDSQINLLKANNLKFLRNNFYLENKLRGVAISNNKYSEELIELKKRIKELEKNRDLLLYVLGEAVE